MIKTFRRLDYFTITGAAVFIGGHLLYWNAPFVNLEFVFSEAARSLFDSANPIGMENYWIYQANPLGYPWIAAVVGQVFGFSHASARLPSLLGGLGILGAGWFYYRRRGVTDKPREYRLWFLLTLCHPWIWNYSGRASSDILPIALVLWALLLCQGAQERPRYDVLASLFLSAAACVKFNALLILPAFICLIATRGSKNAIVISQRLGRMFIYLAVPAVILSLYFSAIYNAYGISFIPDDYKRYMLVDHYRSYFGNALGYAGHFFVALGPLGLLPILKSCRIRTTKWLVMMITAAGFLAVLFYFISFSMRPLELGFGPLSHWLDDSQIRWIRSLAVFMGALFCFGWVSEVIARKRRFDVFVLFLFMSYLLVSSLARPSDRYLIILLPFVFASLVWNLEAEGQTLGKFLVRFSVSFYAVLSVIGVCYHVSQGTAAERMVTWLSVRNYLDKTEVGSMWMHAAHHFYHVPKGPKEYVILTQPKKTDDCLHEEAIDLFGRKVFSYHLCENDDEPS